MINIGAFHLNHLKNNNLHPNTVDFILRDADFLFSMT